MTRPKNPNRETVDRVILCKSNERIEEFRAKNPYLNFSKFVRDAIEEKITGKETKA